MSRIVAVGILAVSILSPAMADDQPRTRAATLKAIQEEYKKAFDELTSANRRGPVQPYTVLRQLQRKTLDQVRVLINADASDAVGLDALVFALSDLGAGESQPELYKLIVKHHIGSERVDLLIRSPWAPTDFLRSITEKTPHVKIRVWATYHLAEKLYAEGKAKDAELLAEKLVSDSTAKDLGGYGMGKLSDTAARLLFEIRRLNVGQDVPELSGDDLDGKPMKLSETRGKVTLVVFWATWCGPCMNMIPHERAFYERFAGKPFTIIGVNGDTIPDDKFKMTGADGKPIDNTALVRTAIEKHGIKWRSFRNGTFTIAMDWNVRSWPTVYLIDHRGIIRGKWKGDPGENELDEAVAKCVKEAAEK